MIRSNKLQYKADLVVEEAKGMNVSLYQDCKLSALLDVEFQDVSSSSGLLRVAVSNIRSIDCGLDVACSSYIKSIIGIPEEMEYHDDVIKCDHNIDDTVGNLVIRISLDRKTLSGVVVFSAPFYMHKYMGGLRISVKAFEVPCVQYQ